MSNLFQPQPPPPGDPTPPGYLPPKPAFIPQQLGHLLPQPGAMPSHLDDAPQLLSTVPQQRACAPPRQRPVIAQSYPPALQPPASRRPGRRSGWGLAIAGMVVALLLATGVVMALDTGGFRTTLHNVVQDANVTVVTGAAT